jgi:spoIIIJ-associated protein
MPITDKIATAKKISEFLNSIFTAGDFRLRYKITVDPQVGADREWERPDILVEISGSDSPLVLENGGELLRAFEHIAVEMLRLGPDEHEKISFDCQNFRSARLQELRLAADVAAERVRKTGTPYAFAPMSSRERRILHLALRGFDDLRTDSDGEGTQRHVVVYPKDYKGAPPPPPVSRRR